MVKLEPCGGVIQEIKLVYYPIGNLHYLWNYNGYKGISLANYMELVDEKTKKKRSWWEIPINNEVFTFEGIPIKRNLKGFDFTNKEISYLIDEKVIKPEELYRKIKSSMEICFDFAQPIDADICAAFILQTWFEDFLNSVFYLSISAKMGSGKTVLLEILNTLSRQGVLANDISFAAIPRIIEKYKANLFIDEIDQIEKDKQNEIYKMLRQGYRKGSVYIRLKQKTMEEEFFKVYGSKAFSYRSDIVDDLKNRSITITTPLSNDKKLPLINYFKTNLLRPIYMDLLKYYLNNTLEIVNKVNEVNDVNVNIDNSNIYSMGKSLSRGVVLIQELRFLPYFVNSVNQNLDTLEDIENVIKDTFSGLTGRNVEIYFTLINICGLANLDASSFFKKSLEDKEEFEKYDEVDMKSILRETLCDIYLTMVPIDGIKFTTHREVARRFNKKMFEEHGLKPSSKELKRYMRELGFIDKVNRKVMKVEGKATLCLIFDAYVKRSLDLDDQDKEAEQLAKLNEKNKEYKQTDLDTRGHNPEEDPLT